MAQKHTPTAIYWLDQTLYLNITNQCPNNCYFCFKHYKQGIGNFNLKLDKEPSVQEITAELDATLHSNWTEFVFCGFGEPTSRLDVLLAVAQWIKQHIGKAVPIRIVTNGQGYLLNPGRDVAVELKAAGIDEVSVSLNAENKELYNEVCKPYAGAYEEVLHFIEQAKKAQLNVEATAVRIPEIDIEATKAVAERFGVSFRVREYSPCFF